LYEFWLALAFGVCEREVAAEYLKKWLAGKESSAKQQKNV
jgi:hypothetical protein